MAITIVHKFLPVSALVSFTPRIRHTRLDRRRISTGNKLYTPFVLCCVLWYIVGLILPVSFRVTAPVPSTANPWRVGENNLHESTGMIYVITLKQSTTKSCA